MTDERRPVQAHGIEEGRQRLRHRRQIVGEVAAVQFGESLAGQVDGIDGVFGGQCRDHVSPGVPPQPTTRDEHDGRSGPGPGVVETSELGVDIP